MTTEEYDPWHLPGEDGTDPWAEGNPQPDVDEAPIRSTSSAPKGKGRGTTSLTGAVTAGTTEPPPARIVHDVPPVWAERTPRKS